VTSARRDGELPLVGAGGEPVDFARTIVSHGVAELPPNQVDLAGRTLETTLPAARGARTVRITEHERKLCIEGSSDPMLAKTVRARPRGRARRVRARRWTHAARADRVRGRRQDDLHADTTTMRRPEWLPRRHNEYERAKGAP
jgi:hypothetical protein